MRCRSCDTDPLFGPEWCIFGATAYTQFATWAAVNFQKTQYVPQECEADEASVSSLATERK